MWSGSVSFGLVTIPISLYTAASDDNSYKANQLCPSMHRIKHKNWCDICNEEIPYPNLKKGYKISGDNYVVLEKEELANIQLDSDKSINIEEFVNTDDIDPIHIEKSYFVAPDLKRGNSKAFQLFVKILKDNNKCGIGKIILRDREDIVALRPYKNGLIIHLLKYVSEVRSINEIQEFNQLEKLKFDPEELKLAKMLVDKFSVKHLDLNQYSDRYETELKKFVEQKAAGKVVEVKVKVSQPIAPDLLDALKASISQKIKVKK